MQTEIVLEDCPHCGGDAKFAGLADWPYLSNIVFCPSCLVKGPQAPDYHLAALMWNKRVEAGPVADDAAEKRGQMNVCLVCHPGRGSRTLSRCPIGSLSESGAFSRPIT